MLLRQLDPLLPRKPAVLLDHLHGRRKRAVPVPLLTGHQLHEVVNRTFDRIGQRSGMLHPDGENLRAVREHDDDCPWLHHDRRPGIEPRVSLARPHDTGLGPFELRAGSVDAALELVPVPDVPVLQQRP